MKANLPTESRVQWASWAALCVAFGFAVCDRTAAANVGGSVVATTDYVFRGLTQTEHRAAAQGDVHLKSSSGWFGGVWGSFALSRPDIASESELNMYVGYAWTLAPDWTGGVHYARYLYPDDRPYAQYLYHDYDELQVTASFQDRVTVSVALAPDIRRYSFSYGALRGGHQWSYESSFRQPLWRNLSVTAGLGHYDLSDLFRDSYWAWSAGMEVTVRQLQITLTRFDTDASARQMFGRQTADGHWALTAAWRF